MIHRLRLLIASLALLALASCGYQFGAGVIPNSYRTVSVPYVGGDTTGLYTASLVKEVSSSTSLQYVNCEGDLVLKVQLCGLREENVGFRYDVQKNGSLAPWIIPAETRIWAVAEVIVVDSESGCIVLGPVNLSAFVDFDHEYYLSLRGVNESSLGQLTDIREAREAAYTPLAQLLAQKIVDYITNAW